ncbi:hypothetical protein ACDI99_10220 [Acinetobacter radioresistens]|uniref:hypothetical protein n=1 Tax=Acinetobacter radioresistens TaxID=40216 RepID=UPI0035569A12
MALHEQQRGEWRSISRTTKSRNLLDLASHPTSHTPQRPNPLLAVLVNLAHIQLLVLVLLRLGSTF